MSDAKISNLKMPEVKKKPRLGTMLFTVLRVLLLSYLGILILLFVFQRWLIYYPRKDGEAALLRLAEGHGLHPWRNRKGELIGWKRALSAQPARYRLIVFHGNAGYALDRLYVTQSLGTLRNGKLWEIYLFEYPGYGARPGAPGEKAFVSAASEALQELSQQDQRPIFLLGESLGCGVAAQVAGRHPSQVAGLFFITPFNNMADVAAYHYPQFPVRWLLLDRFASDQALKNYHGPLGILLAGRDGVVPARFGRRLYDGYDGTKRLWVQEENDHNTLDLGPDAAWWKEVSSFLLGSG